MMSQPIGYGPAITSGMALTVNGSRNEASANLYLRMAERIRETLASGALEKSAKPLDISKPIERLFSPFEATAQSASHIIRLLRRKSRESRDTHSHKPKRTQ